MCLSELWALSRLSGLSQLSQLSRLSRLSGLLGLGLVLCLSVAAYARFLGTGFAASDSLPLVVTSRLDSPDAAWRLFTSPVLAGTTFTQNEVVYRPIVSLTFGLEYLIWGQAAFGYHVTNVALHVVTIASVWLLLRTLGLSAWTSVGGATLFALHPVVVATVPVIARRDSILPVAAFTLAAVLVLQGSSASGGRRWVLTGLSLVLTAVALLSKESAYVAVALLPLLLAAHNFASHSSIFTGPVPNASRPHPLRAALFAVPHLVLAAMLFALRARVLGGLGGIGSDVTEVDLYQYGSSVTSYLREHFWAFAALRPMTREQWLAVGGVVLVGVVLMIAALPRRQAVLVALGGLWVIAFGLFSAIFKVTTIGWLAYFSLVGTVLVVAAGFEGALMRIQDFRLQRASARSSLNWHVLPTGVALTVLTIFSVVSIADSALFRDYPQWQVAGDAQALYLRALESCVSAMPEVPEEEYVSLQRVPEAFQDGRLETDMLGVTIIEQYTAETALRLVFPGWRMNVHVGSVGTLHSIELHFNCAPLPRGIEFTAAY